MIYILATGWRDVWCCGDDGHLSNDIRMQMTIEDATEQLHKMLLSNEEYVGDLSTIVMQTGNEKNYTIDKETVTVSLSKLKLKGKGITGAI